MLITEPLSSSHNKKDFESGKELLDRYLKMQASQDVKRKLAACFVKAEKGSGSIMGYYTLSNNGIPREQIPEPFRKKLPGSYTQIPVTLLGRLAVDKKYQGQGLGAILLVDALKRSHLAADSTASFAVVADPLDEEALSFYQYYGFIFLPGSGKVFLPMKTISALF